MACRAPLTRTRAGKYLASWPPEALPPPAALRDHQPGDEKPAADLQIVAAGQAVT